MNRRHFGSDLYGHFTINSRNPNLSAEAQERAHFQQFEPMLRIPSFLVSAWRNLRAAMRSLTLTRLGTIPQNATESRN